MKAGVVAPPPQLGRGCWANSMTEAWPPLLASASMDPAHWTYHAEGAANILVRYVGPHMWPFYNTLGGEEVMVLRIPKKIHASDVRQVPDADTFLSQVLVHVLPSSSLPCMRRLDMDDTWLPFLQALAEKCEPARPMYRKSAEGMDMSTPHIWMMRDDSRPLPESRLVVEIKPKCGFLPTLPTTRYPCKASLPKYHIQKLYQLGQKAKGTNTQTWYNPLDLFSGDVRRVQRAVDALLDDWMHDTGHLHLFVDGTRKTFKEAQTYIPWLKAPRSLSSRIAHILMENQHLLLTLAQQQQRLDPYDIEGIAQLWEARSGKPLDSTPVEELPHITLTDYAFVAKNPVPVVSSDTDMRCVMAAYLLAATLKDVTLFLPIDDVQGRAMYRTHPRGLRMVDLDAKRTSKLSQHAKKDAAMSAFVHQLAPQYS